MNHHRHSQTNHTNTNTTPINPQPSPQTTTTPHVPTLGETTSSPYPLQNFLTLSELAFKMLEEFIHTKIGANGPTPANSSNNTSLVFSAQSKQIFTGTTKPNMPYTLTQCDTSPLHELSPLAVLTIYLIICTNPAAVY